MNIHLRVREADAVGVKFTLDTLEDIPVDVLQIAALLHTRTTKFTDEARVRSDERSFPDRAEFDRQIR